LILGDGIQDDEIIVSDFVHVQGDVVDLTVQATYSIWYSCAPITYTTLTDSKERLVIVKDTTCPVCQSGGNGIITIEASMGIDQLDGFGTEVNCTDDFHASSSLSQNEVATFQNGTSVDFATMDRTIGEYFVTYTATDANNNGVNGLTNDNVACPSNSVVRTVSVTDTLRPVIGLKFEAGGYHIHSFEDAAINPAQDHTTFKAAVGWTLMEQSSTANGWMIGAIACAVAGVALVASSSKRQTSELGELV